MGYMVLVERGLTSWGGYVTDVPGCLAVAEARDEVLQLIRGAAGLHLEAMRESGVMPAPSSDADFVQIGAA